MKYIWITILVVLITSCSSSNESIINETKVFLSSEKAIIYNINKITTQGADNDTLYIENKEHAIFQQDKNDSLIGYKYKLEMDYYHYRFKLMVNIQYYYDVEKYVSLVTTVIENERVEIKYPNIKRSMLEVSTKGQLPVLLKILNYEGFKFIEQKDTIIDNRHCIKITTISHEEELYELYIDKENKLPKQLRVIVNPTQPFIEEYNYSDFDYSDSFDEPSFVSEKNNLTEKPKALVTGDVIPNWDLKFVSGNDFSIKDFSAKNKVVFISTIYCSYCNAAIPIMQKMYDKYRSDNNVDFLVYYPLDTEDKLIKYIAAKKINYPISFYRSDNKFEMHQQLPYGFPFVIILNYNNEIVHINRGYTSDMDIVIDSVLVELFPK